MSKAIVVMTSFIFVLGASLAPAQDILPGRYHTYQEVSDTLAALENTYPEIMYVDTMGYSTRDSIPMLRVKLSDNPQIDEDEPSVFYCGGVHADEVLGVEVVVNFIYDLLDQYDQGNNDIQNYLENLEIFVVPFINPEGHTVVEQGDLDWRKNKSDNDSNGVFDFHDGVDNNRNYDFGWEIDDEPDAIVPESLQFKGWAPFTETENIAMAAFAWKYRPLIALDHHSPTYGRPNVAYYPWYWYGSDGGHGFGPDESLMQSICATYTSQILAIPDDSNTVHYTARRALVNKGDFKTYFYGNFGTAAFSVECSDTTIQNPALVDSIVDAHLPGLYWLLGRALGPGITGVIRDSVTLEPIEAEVQVTQHLNDDINPRLSRPDFGRYNRLLAPGSYTLRFLKDGYRTKSVYGVGVGSNGPTETDVLLYPYNPRPPAPELTFPAMYDTLEENSFTFEWSEPVYANGYLLEVSVDPEFDSFVILDSTLSSNQYVLSEPLDSGYYYWRVRAFNNNGWGPYSDMSEFWLSTATGIDDGTDIQLPGDFMLYQNYPNPFNASTRISFYISQQSRVKIELYDITGGLIRVLADSQYSAGTHSLVWNGTDNEGKELSSGVYLYRFKADGLSATKRLVLIK
jgi:hypothetical protein